MDLREYLFRERMSATDFAKHINYDRAYLYKIIHGNRVPGKKLAMLIETATGGKVKAKELLKEKK